MINKVRFVAVKESIKINGNQDIQTKTTIIVFALFAEIERELVREQTRAGLAAARARGRKGGRKFVLTKAQVRLAEAAMKNGG